MEDNKVLRLVYTFFLGLLLAMFVGIGINTFYPGPEAPEHTAETSFYDKEPGPEQLENQREFDEKFKEYDEKMQTYNRNVSITALLAAFLFLAVSILFDKKIKVIADGIMLGGLFTLLYGIIRGFASDNSGYIFIAVTAGLAVVLFLGYRKFVRD